MRYADALAELNARQPERMLPDLDRITELAALLGDPQLTYPTIHLTGTNGKTTTARVTTALACAAGLTTGLYTSPHLLSVTERLQVCDGPIAEGEFADEYAHLLPYVRRVDERGVTVTYFEVLTALAYLWFADKPVDLGVFEVGMGGLWDATNLVAGDVAVIGEIGLDHPELGSTVAEVAREKAGIIKTGKVAVSREQRDEALKVIEARCAEVAATLVLEGRDFEVVDRHRAVGGQVLTVRGVAATYEELFVPLFGEHAARNAGVAVVAFEAFLARALDAELVRGALSAATSPGRLEIVQRRPLLVFDGAHNPAGAGALAESLREDFTWDRLHLVIAVSADKDLDGIVAPLAPLVDRAYAANNGSVRSADGAAVEAALAERGVPVERFASVAAGIEAARASAGEGDLILVTGSLYTVADARRAIDARP
jgi:dihydrofolate synthase / folylpolyglutamate synthase